MMDDPLGIELAGVRLRNPVIAAAGTCGYGAEFDRVLPASALGAITLKSITPEARDGNQPWRILDAKAGMLNAIGLANCGLEAFLHEKLPAAAALDTVLIGSIAGHSVEEYCTVAKAFGTAEALSLVEVNASCPNTSDGRQFSADPSALGELIEQIRRVLGPKPMLVKLPPDMADPVGMCSAAVDAGASGLTLSNTWPALAIDVESRKPRLSRGTGGFSGPGIHPMVVKLVREVFVNFARDRKVPIVGLGGVLDWEDAAEFVLAGATGVGLGTALFVDPALARKCAKGLHKWANRQGQPLQTLIGAMDEPGGPA